MDWKEQLQQVYKTIQHKAKHERPKDKFDLELIQFQIGIGKNIFK